MAEKKFVHVLISATYATTMPIPSKILGDAVADRLVRTEELHTITSYSMAYPIRPIDVGLKDAWDQMHEAEREEFSDQYPQLATAIALICGGDDERQPGIEKDSSAGKN